MRMAGFLGGAILRLPADGTYGVLSVSTQTCPGKVRAPPEPCVPRFACQGLAMHLQLVVVISSARAQTWR